MKTTRACIVFTVLAFAATFLLASVPSLINYQGKLLKPDGTPIADGVYNMTFAIYDVPVGGLPLWSEKYNATSTIPNPVTVKKGLFAVLMGSVNNMPANIFDGPSRWFGITVGTDPEMTPRQQIASVPFAVKAGCADKVIDGAITSSMLADGSITKSKIAADATADINNSIGTGWIAANDTWSMFDAYSINVASGAPSKYAIGDKIQFTQDGIIKYFYVYAITTAGLNITAGSDFTLTNSPITSPNYSHASSPVGFPGSFSILNPCIVWTGGTTNPAAFNNDIMVFSINGRSIQWNWWFYSTNIATGYRTGVQVSLPITPIQINYARYSGNAVQYNNGVLTSCSARIFGGASYVLVDGLNMSDANSYEIYASGSCQF